MIHVSSVRCFSLIRCVIYVTVESRERDGVHDSPWFWCHRLTAGHAANNAHLFCPQFSREAQRGLLQWAGIFVRVKGSEMCVLLKPVVMSLASTKFGIYFLYSGVKRGLPILCKDIQWIKSEK